MNKRGINIMKNIKTILANDHKGNKALIIVQGDLSVDMVMNAEYLEGEKVAKLEKRIFDDLKNFAIEAKNN